MIREDINDLLSLLALTIFADKKVIQSEVETFVTAANQLQVLREFEPRLSEPRLLAWYNTNKIDLIQIMERPDFEVWLKKCLDGVQSIKDKNALLSVMGQISLADGEVHISEKALMVFCARHWGIKLR